MGLATRIHNTPCENKASLTYDEARDLLGPESTYYIKGPMGRGLQLQPEGLHVAFCAGTGALVFLDLVSHLIINNAFKAKQLDLPEQMNFY